MEQDFKIGLLIVTTIIALIVTVGVCVGLAGQRDKELQYKCIDAKGSWVTAQGSYGQACTISE